MCVCQQWRMPGAVQGSPVCGSCEGISLLGYVRPTLPAQQCLADLIGLQKVYVLCVYAVSYTHLTLPTKA